MKNYKCGIICGSFDRPEKCKPVQSLDDRVEILEAIKYIDKIVTYNTEKELDEILGTEKYDVRILGSDYRSIEDYTGAHYEKPVHLIERNHNFSTTDIKLRISKSMMAKILSD